MLTFLKLGGSLITDKTRENAFLPEVTARISREIAEGIRAQPGRQLLIGHGSGSFGHMAAKRHGTMQGVQTDDQWRGFAEVANTAAELNYLTAKALWAAGVPVIRIQPSASVRSRDGVVVEMAVAPVRAALAHGLAPLVYGDVALDEMRGGTIVSTETIFFYLARRLPVDEILLLGNTDGVYATDGSLIEAITPANLADVEAALGGSAGTDVTGGMETKVRDMVALAQTQPGLRIRIMNGVTPGLLAATLAGAAAPGTLIHSG
ncbi:MAG: isopentenyl phosphate kinase family protein [Anaerolineae bacterium]|nr:isopentenyl phosphate kinase family protein [Anaerolineae bacterium]